MNKRWRLVAASLLFWAITTSSGITLAGPPPLPSSFYGSVRIRGENVPPGTVVSAWISDTLVAQTTVLLYQGSTVYALDVPGDDPDTPQREGGVQGEVVLFRVGNQFMPEAGVWRSGTNTRLDLGRFRVIYPILRRGS